jgi:putative restriction endonuclease
MTTPSPPLVASRLEKAATDNGFDVPLGREGDWLAFASSQTSLRVWLATFGHALYLVAFSQLRVTVELGELGTPLVSPLPQGAVTGRSVGTAQDLHELVRRAFQLSKVPPDEPLEAFERAARAMPRKTEAERLYVQRVGQEYFREELLRYWQGRCAVTGLGVEELLRASHIKPWAHCASNEERLDVFNGFLLAPHLDVAFDRGFITVADDGALVLAGALDAEARRLLGLDASLRVRALDDRHRRYLPWHREKVFQKARS